MNSQKYHIDFFNLHSSTWMLIFLISLILFVASAWAINHSAPAAAFDIRIVDWMHSRTTPPGLEFFEKLSLLGSGIVITALGICGAFYLLWKKELLSMAVWSFTFAGGGILERALKLSIRRPRPEFAAQFLHDFSYSFPSSHAMTSLIAFGMLAYVLVTFAVTNRAAQYGIVLCAMLLVPGIGFSRLYLGVHYPTDIIGGFAAGACWLSICIGVMQMTRNPRHGLRAKTP